MIKAILPTWPAPAFVVCSVFVLDIQVLRANFIVNPVPTVHFNMRVYNGDHLRKYYYISEFVNLVGHKVLNNFLYKTTLPTHLASLFHEPLKHFFGFWELLRVPGEVAFAISVLNVQPDEVEGDVVLIKTLVHSFYIFLIVVVPATLMVSKSGQRREGLRAQNSSEQRERLPGLIAEYTKTRQYTPAVYVLHNKMYFIRYNEKIYPQQYTVAEYFE